MSQRDGDGTEASPEAARGEHGAQGGQAEDEVASTPFDNPFFLPVVLLGFSLWLAYDGFFNAQFIADHQADDQRWVLGFNRWGALVCALFGAYFAFRAYRERTAVRGEESGS